MQVEVTVFATLRHYMPGLPIGGSRQIDVQPGTTVADLMHALGLPSEEVKVVMRNHLQAELSDAVEDGDRIAYIPAVAGG
ncbi:MAG: MoaD/ThiS family protein [Anaerolineales bacterium]|nr:MoaD/ThiS family protein [Anaerolineales bacterium]